jgi:radical SAM-linked protein
VDFELTQVMEIEEFRQKLSAQLPTDLPIYEVVEVDIKSPSATQLLERAEYVINITTSGSQSEVNQEMIQTWIDGVLASQTIEWQQTTKSGKVKIINLRSRLFELILLESDTDCHDDDRSSFQLRFIGSCRNDGTLLKPEHIIYMLEQVSQQDTTGVTVELRHTHRVNLILNDI